VSTATTSAADFEIRETTLHGHKVCYRMAGEGPAIALIHGVTSHSGVWSEFVEDVVDAGYTVIAPDLFGHGASAKPKGDYSLGAFASGVRDLLGMLGFERATVVGHSLGGGIGLQLAYQFPEYCERLVLISSGGLGREVSPLLRVATLPGAELVMPFIIRDWAVHAGSSVADLLGRLGVHLRPDIEEMGRGYASLVESDAQGAFLHTLRAVIDAGGQKVSAMDRLYLAERMPVLIIWGERDPIIPVKHGRAAHAAIPHSHMVEIPNAGHWPQLDQPRLVCKELTDFISGTEPFRFDLDLMREQLRQGPPASG
jgi:Predicted hydrolases or acyltransferases (alpha/beta hydrolase superfamily)